MTSGKLRTPPSVRPVSELSLPPRGARRHGRLVGAICACGLILAVFVPRATSVEPPAPTSGVKMGLAWQDEYDQWGWAFWLWPGLMGALALTGAFLRSPVRGVCLLTAGVMQFVQWPVIVLLRSSPFDPNRRVPPEWYWLCLAPPVLILVAVVLGGLLALLRRRGGRVRRGLVVVPACMALLPLAALFIEDGRSGHLCWPPVYLARRMVAIYPWVVPLWIAPWEELGPMPVVPVLDAVVTTLFLAPIAGALLVAMRPRRALIRTIWWIGVAGGCLKSAVVPLTTVLLYDRGSVLGDGVGRLSWFDVTVDQARLLCLFILPFVLVVAGYASIWLRDPLPRASAQ